MHCDLGLWHTRGDRSYPPRTSRFRCRADLLRTSDRILIRTRSGDAVNAVRGETARSSVEPRCPWLSAGYQACPLGTRLVRLRWHAGGTAGRLSVAPAWEKRSSSRDGSAPRQWVRGHTARGRTAPCAQLAHDRSIP